MEWGRGNKRKYPQTDLGIGAWLFMEGYEVDPELVEEGCDSIGSLELTHIYVQGCMGFIPQENQ